MVLIMEPCGANRRLSPKVYDGTLINLILSNKTESKDLLVFNLILLIVCFIICIGTEVFIFLYFYI